MKKLLCLLLAVLMAVSVSGAAVTADDDAILMIYDSETNNSNGTQPPWGFNNGFNGDLFTEGEYSIGVQAVMFDGLMFFHNTEADIGYAPDLSDYDYIEFDLYSFYDMVCNMELMLCANTAAHHGSDYEMFQVFFPAEQFVHVRMPLKDFVVHAVDRRDSYDEENDTGLDEAHYSGYGINHVARLHWEFTYCVTLDGEPCEDVEILFDNVTAVKGDATHAHNDNQEVQPLQYWADVKDQYVPAESTVPSQPNVPSAPQTKRGDVNADGTVNANDALMVLKAAVGKQKLTQNQQQRADLNDDTHVNAADALIILKIAVGRA